MTTHENTMTSEEASARASHKAKTAQAAVEEARELQLAEAIAKTAKETKSALIEGLKEVFGDGDEQNPNQMRILVRRIPILCTSVEQMRQDIARVAVSNDKTNMNITWGVRIVIGAIIAALLKIVLV